MSFYDSEGRLRRLPASWTDVGAADAFTIQAAGRSRFRFLDLVAVAVAVAAWERESAVKGKTPSV